MKVRLVMGTVIISTSMMLSGCGSDNPEDVAETFASALSEADMKSAREVASEDTLKKIDQLETLCNSTYYKELRNEVLTVYKAKNSATSRIRSTRYDPVIGKEWKEKKTKMADELIKEYGSKKNVPKEKLEKGYLALSSELSTKYIVPLVSDIMDEAKIKIKYHDDVEGILKRLLDAEIIGRQSYSRMGDLSRAEVVYAIIEQGDYENNDNINAECVAKYTEYDFIDSINVIEVETESADRASVRLELIDKNDKSTKVSVPVEKIKDEWKVSELSLDIY